MCPILRAYLVGPTHRRGEYRWSAHLVCGNLPAVRIRFACSLQPDEICRWTWPERDHRVPAIDRAIGRRGDRLAMVLSAVRPDPGRRRHRLRGGCGDPRAGRHGVAGNALAAAAAAFRPRAGRQRIDRDICGARDRRARRDVPHDVAKPQLPADGCRQAGAGVARDPAGDLGDPQHLHRQAGVGNGMVHRRVEHPRPARSGGRRRSIRSRSRSEACG